jgi:hypothetical protein
MEFLNQDVNTFHRIDYYLAQIAAEVRRTYVKHPKRVKLSDFLLKFRFRGGGRRSERMSKEERTKVAKRFWFGVLGLKQRR